VIVYLAIPDTVYVDGGEDLTMRLATAHMIGVASIEA
jgi:hypothetical protein